MDKNNNEIYIVKRITSDTFIVETNERKIIHVFSCRDELDLRRIAILLHIIKVPYIDEYANEIMRQEKRKKLNRK